MTRSAGLLDRRLLFVTGKGGVGKTSVASAIAVLAAEHGKRTLICEVDSKGDLADFFGVGRLKFQPTELRENLFGMAMDTEESLKEYLRLFLKIPLVSRLGVLASTFDFLANAAPGVKEVLTVGKLTHEVRENNYDLVVVDASATGHVVGQLASPVAINDLVKVGLVRNQTDWMIEILTDTTQTGVVVVTAPEEMPVAETLELIDRLGSETDIGIAAVVVNRVLPELFSRDDEALFAELREEEPLEVLRDEIGPGVDVVLDGAEMAVSLRRGRLPHLTRLRDGLPSTIELLYMPYLFHRSHGIRATARIAEELGAELGY
ncbi:MAG TPA: ArsA family ATPase [Microthrixaceae bacterium]|nr:ArsA family ATPase [Microthrixaceae bacterium]